MACLHTSPMRTGSFASTKSLSKGLALHIIRPWRSIWSKCPSEARKRAAGLYRIWIQANPPNWKRSTTADPKMPSDLNYPSLAFNLVEVSQRGPQACRGALPTLDPSQSPELEKVNYRGPKNAFDHLSVRTLKTLKNLPASAVHPLHGKIVLLGGAYRAARDAYATPFGYLDGVDIIANTVDMNLPGNKELKDMPAWVMVAGYAQAVLLLAGLYFVSRTWSLLIHVLVVPVYALLINWLAFQ